MVTDDKIRAAIDLAVERTPNGDRVLAALAGQQRRRGGTSRRRVLMLAGAAATVAAAGAVPLLSARKNDVPAVRPSRTPSEPTVPSPIAMPYRLTVVPEGYSESERFATGSDDAGWRWQRNWYPDTDNNPGRIWLRSADATEDDRAQMTRVDLGNGREGLRRDDGDTTHFIVPASDGREVDVLLRALPIDDQKKIAVAASVVADPGVFVEPMVRFGWLPDPRMHYVLVGLRKLHGDWQASVDTSAGPVPGSQGWGIAVTVGSPSDPDKWMLEGRLGGEVWKVRGVDGNGRIDGGYASLKLPLAADLVLTMNVTQSTRPITRDIVTRVADSLQIGPKPDLTWLGLR